MLRGHLTLLLLGKGVNPAIHIDLMYVNNTFIFIYIENNVDNLNRQSPRTDSALMTGTNYQIHLCSRLAPSQSSLSNTQNTTTSYCRREKKFYQLKVFCFFIRMIYISFSFHLHCTIFILGDILQNIYCDICSTLL